MMRVALYSLATLVALTGLYGGIELMAPHLIDRMDGTWSLNAEGAQSFAFGVVVARVFVLPEKTAPAARPASDVAGTPWENSPGFTNR